jgi:hypothetical protein
VALAKDLKKRGWSFVGPTTVYAFMQAMGLVNDPPARVLARAWQVHGAVANAFHAARRYTALQCRVRARHPRRSSSAA